MLEKQFGKHFVDVNMFFALDIDDPDVHPQIMAKDDYLPMYVEKANERDCVLDTVWLSKEEHAELVK